MFTTDAPLLVTGATGTVGREVLRAALAAGHAVRALVPDPDGALDRLASVLPDGARHRAERRLQAARWDFLDRRALGDAVAGGTRLFLLRPPAIADVDGAIAPAIDAALDAGVRHVAFLSIQGAERNRLVPHRAIEDHLRGCAARDPRVTWHFVRAAFFMQNLLTAHGDELRRESTLHIPAGDGRTAFVDAVDLGDAIVRLLAEPVPTSAAHECTGREALDYDEVVAILSRALGRPIWYDAMGLVRFYRRRRAMGEPRALVGVMCALYTATRLGLADRCTPDLERLLGRAPRTLAEFARDNAAAFAPASPA
ncbi:MAG: NmrA family NAD(P)-binding protein [Gemmatimonadaceae bacterium]|nr:NmrA family NAD(P)-binding protein [Gemmatimonadaceae bacterium]